MSLVYQRGLDRENKPYSYKTPSGISRVTLGEGHRQGDLVPNSHSAQIL